MMRRAFLGLLFLALSTLVPAHRSTALPPVDEVLQFNRNLALIEALVDSSVRLIQDDDPLLRAEACVHVARQFAAELREAADHRNAARAAELGVHLLKLLESGVASNLQAARKQIPEGSTAETKLREVGTDAFGLLRSLHQSLRATTEREESDEVRTLLEDLSRKQTGLEQAFRLSPAAPQ